MRNSECVKVQDGGVAIGLAAKVGRTIPFTLEDSKEIEA